MMNRVNIIGWLTADGARGPPWGSAPAAVSLPIMITLIIMI